MLNGGIKTKKNTGLILVSGGKGIGKDVLLINGKGIITDANMIRYILYVEG